MWPVVVVAVELPVRANVRQAVGMSRWNNDETVLRGTAYDDRWTTLAKQGHNVHGEADFIEALLDAGSVLDAGCGTGRVAIELARRGFDVVGVDLDERMLVTAREKAPDLSWVTGDLSTVQLDRRFDAVAMPGNVMIFVEAGSEARAIANMARLLHADGLLIAGFQLGRRDWTLEHYDQWCDRAGLGLVGRFATWDRDPFDSECDYAVSVHQHLGASS